MTSDEPRSATESERFRSMRSGTECCVKLLNYRKDGSVFENLLVLRPVTDSNHLHR